MPNKENSIDYIILPLTSIQFQYAILVPLSYLSKCARVWQTVANYHHVRQNAMNSIGTLIALLLQLTCQLPIPRGWHDPCMGRGGGIVPLNVS
jgi:hypothetical protein